MVDHNSSLPETRDERFVWDYRFLLRLPTPDAYGRFSIFANLYNLTDSDYLYRTSRPKAGTLGGGGRAVCILNGVTCETIRAGKP